MRGGLFQHHRYADRIASADPAHPQVRQQDIAARLWLSDEVPDPDQARLQKSEIRHRDVGAEQRRRRLLGEPGLQLVFRFIGAVQALAWCRSRGSSSAITSATKAKSQPTHRHRAPRSPRRRPRAACSGAERRRGGRVAAIGRAHRSRPALATQCRS